jgi:MoaA/NifB/PqqE/SkfB family radical SAM enzyme
MGILHGNRAFGGPMLATLSLTNRCNIRCVHCFFYSPHLEEKNLLLVKKERQLTHQPSDEDHLSHLRTLDAEPNRTNAVIDELLCMGTASFLITGSGEPFLHKDALEFMGRICHASCTCSVNTNGTLLDRETVDALIKMGLRELRVTAMAGTREAYLRTHPGSGDGAFDSLRAGLLYLSERKAALDVRHPQVTLACLVVAQNCNDLLAFAEFAALVQADLVQYRPVYAIGDQGLAKVVPTEEQADSVRQQLIHVKNYLKSKGISHNIDYFLSVFRGDLDTSGLYRMIPCYYGWISTRIEEDGAVHPCCRCYESLGNCYEKGLHEIWYGEAYRSFRREAFALNRRKTPVSGCACDGCPHYTANIRVYKALHPVGWKSALKPTGDQRWHG